MKERKRKSKSERGIEKERIRRKKVKERKNKSVRERKSKSLRERKSKKLSLKRRYVEYDFRSYRS